MSSGLRRLLALARPEWMALTLGTLLLLISTGAGLAYPQAIRVILDEAIVQGEPEAIDNAALLMLVLFIVQGIAGGFRNYVFTTAGERIVATLRKTLYTRIMGQEIGFFDGRRTGELLSRLSADAGVLQNAVSVNISMALRSGASAVGGVGLLFWISPTLTLLMMAVVPPVALAAGFFGQRIQRLARDS
ncbi:MAG: ABC transporter transmembrane domain-containing protein, partial [Myxococcota bacterium]